MAPVQQGYCKLESLNNGEITLFDLARANDHIAIIAENRRRAQEARK